MDEKDKLIADQGMQIVLIHRELKSLTSYIENVDKSLSILGTLDKTLLTQQTILEAQDRRIQNLERDLSEHRNALTSLSNDHSSRIQSLRDQTRDDRYSNQQAFLAKIDEVIKASAEREKEKEGRVRALENWRWYILGIMAAAGLALTGVPWKIIFAN